MSKVFQQLKALWPWVLGLIGSFLIWLKFVHNPRVAGEAVAKLKLKRIEEQRRRLRKDVEDTTRQEEKLNKKRRKLHEDLQEKTNTSSGSLTADRMARRFGWTRETE